VMQPLATRDKHLLISDMDSTLIEQECIDELADCVGLREQVSAITAHAMNGALEFEAALRERVALLRGLNACELQRVYDTRITA
ncbi:phosphoserine phosphatase SerB, partial [Staphylococcus aureus]